jgi:hypothetical protein
LRAPASRLLGVLGWVPRRVRREFKTHGGEPRFLMWVSFLLAFAWARTWVLYVGHHAPNVSFSEFEIGSRVTIAGYHPHHIASGVLLLAIVGWLHIHYRSQLLLKITAVLYGVGLGLIVDEIGFIVEGIVPYRDDFAEVFVLVVAISALMMSSVYFPSFWASIERRVGRLYARHLARLWRRRAPQAASPPPVEALPVEAEPPTKP